eukprot:Skav225805  [mRNA]  locus=scaffold5154:174268:180015:- [translate_table: standard]
MKLQTRVQPQQVEDNIEAKDGFVKMLRDYVSEKTHPNSTIAWNMISLSRDGLNRKLLRSSQLIRFAELLPMFPEVPPDSLLWVAWRPAMREPAVKWSLWAVGAAKDYVDVINNQSAPKAAGTCGK